LKNIINWVWIIASLFLISGCSNKEAIDQVGCDVVLSVPNNESELFIDIINDMKEALSDVDLVLNYEASNDSVSIQISKIEKFLEDKPDYMIIYPISIYGLEKVMKKANAIGTKIIIIGGDVNKKANAKVLARVMSNHELEGKLSAKELYRFFNNTSNKLYILELQGKLGTTQTRDRAKGFRDQLLKYNNIELIDVSQNNINRNDAYTHTKEMIDEHGTAISGIFVHDNEIGLGVIDAFIEADYDLSLIPIVSIGGDEDVTATIYVKQNFSSIQSKLKYGEIIVDIIQDDLDGKVVTDIILPTKKLDSNEKE